MNVIESASCAATASRTMEIDATAPTVASGADSMTRVSGVMPLARTPFELAYANIIRPVVDDVIRSVTAYWNAADVFIPKVCD